MDFVFPFMMLLLLAAVGLFLWMVIASQQEKKPEAECCPTCGQPLKEGQEITVTTSVTRTVGKRAPRDDEDD